MIATRPSKYSCTPIPTPQYTALEVNPIKTHFTHSSWTCLNHYLSCWHHPNLEAQDSLGLLGKFTHNSSLVPAETCPMASFMFLIGKWEGTGGIVQTQSLGFKLNNTVSYLSKVGWQQSGRTRTRKQVFKDLFHY